MNDDAIRILIVDDHELFRRGLRLLVQQQPGMVVVGEAGTSAAALEQARSLSPSVVLMDLHLPDETGIQCSRRILEEFPGIKIIALSADASLALVHDALQAGISGYLVKQNSTDDLIRAIRAALDARLYLCPEVASYVVTDYLRTLAAKTAPTEPVLTPRELHLLRLVAEGKRSKEIAVALQVGVKSVETYRSRLMHKLGCASPVDLARYAIRHGISTP